MNKKFLSIKVGTLTIMAPDKILLKKTLGSLQLIKKIDFKEYEKIFSRLKIIFITNKTGYTNEFFMPEKIWFANKSVILNNDLAWLSSLVIHEAFHATQFKNGEYTLPFGDELEKPALDLQEKFLKKCKDFYGERDVRSVFEEKYWDEMAGDSMSASYFRNLLYLFENKNLQIKNIGIKIDGA